MSVSEDKTHVHVRIFGFLRQYMKEQGKPYILDMEIPGKGMSAYEIARLAGLPAEDIEAVFCNGKVINIYDEVYPNDRVAFFPAGTPGPYRVFLRIVGQNKERKKRDKGHP